MVVGGTMVKSITWFDNGWGYAARVIDVIEKLAAFEKVPA
jgi:glyceraldehyde-3-phosphate dehydrogenase/erythrose-4-phosphate dehydrogenase